MKEHIDNKVFPSYSHCNCLTFPPILTAYSTLLPCWCNAAQNRCTPSSLGRVDEEASVGRFELLFSPHKLPAIGLLRTELAILLVQVRGKKSGRRAAKMKDTSSSIPHDRCIHPFCSFPAPSSSPVVIPTPCVGFSASCRW